MTKEGIIAAIRRAAAELGKAPSRGELRRLTGVSHYRVLAQFRTLREAVRAAGLEPNPKGEKISTGDLIKDWKRVGRKLGRRPSRAEYVREGKYSAGAFVARFGSWGKIGGNLHHGDNHPAKPKPGSSGTPDTETRRKKRSGNRVIGRSGDRPATQKPRAASARSGGHFDNGSEKAIAMRWATQLAQVPGPVAGKRRVTEAVAAMVVNTLLGESSQQPAFSIQPGKTYHGDTEARRTGKEHLGVRKDRAVMGPPFDRSPMTNAPVNEMGVVLLFGIVATDLGFQVESLWGRYPDCEARREVAPGKWQRCRIEFEYESKNFLLHGHDPKKCDVIVCWRHNWKECPEEIEVIELSRLFGMR